MRTPLYGRGTVNTVLNESEVRGICADALGARSLKGKNVLVLIPDHTRHAPIDLFFRIIFEEIGQDVRALLEGGLPILRVTFRTKAAATALARIAETIPAILLGAGTVLSVELVKTAVTSGAKHIVSPGLNRKVVEYCLSNSICVIPAVASRRRLKVHWKSV
jgi:hypothetical protein